MKKSTKLYIGLIATIVIGWQLVMIGLTGKPITYTNYTFDDYPIDSINITKIKAIVINAENSQEYKGTACVSRTDSGVVSFAKLQHTKSTIKGDTLFISVNRKYPLIDIGLDESTQTLNIINKSRLGLNLDHVIAKNMYVYTKSKEVRIFDCTMNNLTIEMPNKYTELNLYNNNVGIIKPITESIRINNPDPETSTLDLSEAENFRQVQVVKM